MRETLNSLQLKLVERHISKIEVATLESLSQLMRKSGLVKDIRIDRESFGLTLSARWRTSPGGWPVKLGGDPLGTRALRDIDCTNRD